MNLTPWRPTALENRTQRPLLPLQQEIDRLFDEFFQGSPLGRMEEGWLGPRTFTPRIDVHETETGLNVSAELPGMTEKDVEIQIQDEYLTIRGEKKAQGEHKDRGWLVSERSYGAFERTIGLSADLDPDKAMASYKNGVLTVSVPRKEGVKRNVRKLKVAAEH